MIIDCNVCGRPVCSIDVPESDDAGESPALKAAKVGTFKRALTLLPFGGDLLAFLPMLDGVLINPDPAVIKTKFNLRCVNDCSRR